MAIRQGLEDRGGVDPPAVANDGLAACDHRSVIDRAVRLALATSSTTSVLVLVAFNLIPVTGVLFWGWNVATLLVLYWVENGIVGLLNVPKMLLASGPDEPASRVVPVRGIGPVTVARSGMTTKAALVPFFLVHYGIFWFVHGVFVFTLPLFIGVGSHGFGQALLPPGLGGSTSYGMIDQAPSIGPNLAAVAWGAVGLAISHTASFLVNFVGRGEYRRVSAARQMVAPYGRLVILHLTILFGAFVSLAIGSPIGAVVVLVLLKTIVDLAFHVREHGGLGTLPQPG
jgi:hypothetical protein